MLSVLAVSALWTASAVWGHPPDLAHRQTPITNQYIHPGLNTSMCLSASSNINGAAVDIEPCVAVAESQQWTVGSTISAFGGTMCLDVTNGNGIDGDLMQIWECTAGDTNQEWTVSGETIQWTDTSFCLDLTNGITTNGNIVQIWGCTDGPNQQWTITETVTTPPTLFNIQPGASDTTCLTAPANADGVEVVVQPCDGSTGQFWQQVGQTLIVWGDYCLDVTKGNISNGVPLQIYQCTPGQGDANQQWEVLGNTIQWGGTDECVDLTNGELISGTPAQTWECVSGDTNQVWRLVEAVQSGSS